MISCEAMTDRMPDVARGAAEWSTEEREHLQGCAACAAEWRMVRVARHLRTPVAERFDAEAVSAAVRGRMAEHRRRRRWTRGAWLVGLAAAASVVLLVRGGGGPEAPPAVTATGLTLPQAELEQLNEAQLERVLDLLGGPVGEVTGDPAPTMDGLDDLQLERVLRSLEG